MRSSACGNATEPLQEEESNLGRALAEHARHALSESRGSHSTWDVAADAEQVYAALMQYEALVQRVASDFRSLVALFAPSENDDPRRGNPG